ncbi:NO-inducible flavohemoprotein [Echinicola marina]|uniref:NO-inducible flavohemoprotein n=1 Tax=Echinicola marina TaxID=2859768 RepID=UPI001CF67FC3|nr:NO-inducible flavohemoprotein [Echinicola marina]UCS92485.1 NO-inducible flavohemoprotein [Echinicola marina]
MASAKTIEIVKSTAPVLKEHGEIITKVFYKNIFTKHPELKNIFNMTHQAKGSQPKVLANAIFQYATYIDQLEMLSGAVNAIAHKHSSLSITPEMYPIVGENLLLAIKEVLGDAATEEIIDAWAEAYGDLAKIFIQTEETIYHTQEKRAGGFRGKKQFKVVQKTVESEIITSFYLQPADGSEVPHFVPGQYIALSVQIPGEKHLHTRNYSLSDLPAKDSLRISVKKEPGNPVGIVSNFLHTDIVVGDILEIGMPSGEFTLKNSEKPVVLIAGGVGITPLLSMYKQLNLEDKKVTLFQCAINSDVQAFRNEIQTISKAQSEYKIVYSDPTEEDVKVQNFDHRGLLTVDILQASWPAEGAEVYFCGPKPFMRHVNQLLSEMEISEENIHFEFFGPSEDLKQESLAL